MASIPSVTAPSTAWSATSPSPAAPKGPYGPGPGWPIGAPWDRPGSLFDLHPVEIGKVLHGGVDEVDPGRDSLQVHDRLAIGAHRSPGHGFPQGIQQGYG